MDNLSLETSYQRALLYQLKHFIFHNAIIHPAVTLFLGNTVHGNFGYAPSTIKYQAKYVPR